MNVKQLFTRYNYNLDLETKCILVLGLLHSQGRITDAKLKGQFQALRNGTLLKVKGTHHSGINNRWYDHEDPYDIFKDYLNLTTSWYLSNNEAIEYFSRYYNKGYNYSINAFLGKIIEPILNNWHPDWSDEEFGKYSTIEFPFDLKAKGYTSECYSCGSRHTEYDRNQNDIRKELSEYFHKMKKGNLSKIPKFIL